MSRDMLYTPAEIGALTLEEIERRGKDKSPGVAFGLPNIDSKLAALRPGQLAVILGRPSMYKSGLAQWWARKLALKQQVERDDKVVLYVTTEMAIEELGLYDLAVSARLDAGMVARGEVTDDDVKKLKEAATHRSALPLYLLGHSLSRRKKRLSINMFTVEQCLLWMEDHMQLTAKAVFIDYLNLLDSNREPGKPPAPDRRIAIIDIVKCAKDMALFLGCPVILLAQASRKVDEKQWKMPEMADGLECVAGDTLIMDAATGDIKSVEQWYAEGVVPTVHGKAGWWLRPARPKWLVQNGVRPVLKITTRGGSSIRVTTNHPMYRDDGFVMADELNVGDWLAVAKNLTCAAQNDLSAIRAEFLGLMLGDGSYIDGATPSYVCGRDVRLGEYVCEIAEREWGVRTGLLEHSKYPGNYQTWFCGPANVGPGKNEIINWLREIGVYGERHDDATVPGVVQRGSLDIVKAFLRGYVSTDGSFPVPQHLSHPAIYYSSVSRIMLEQVRYLLLRCGIPSRLYAVQPGNRNVKVCYNLCIAGITNVTRFMEDIGFAAGDRADKARETYATAKETWTGKRIDTDLWPPSICMSAIRKVKEYGKRTGEYKRVTLNMVKGRAISARRLAHVGREIKEQELIGMGEGDITWDRIKSIEQCEPEMTYDLNVPGGHSFVANGFVTHNSSAIEQYADVIMSVWYPKVSESTPTITSPSSKTYQVNDNLLFLALLKQKQGPAGGMWPLFVDPTRNEIAMFQEDDYRTRYF